MRIHNQRGDTIVEVLFAMVVIGVTLAAAFSISNRSLLIGRAAQERNEALKIAESRVELVRIAHKHAITPGPPGGGNVDSRPQPFCISPTSTAPGYNVTAISAMSTECKTLDSSGKSVPGGIYTLKIEGPTVVGNGSYRVEVTWFRIADNSTEKLEVWYRPGVL